MTEGGVDLVGDTVELEVGPIAHGGHCVARWDGRVVFVRHSLPGERVRVRITGQTSRFLRADAIEVLREAPGRVESRCPVSGPGGCGGCDFQHVDPGTQRQLLAGVVTEQLRRLAGIEWDVTVERVGDDGVDGALGWRTRMTYTNDRDGRPGLRRHRSHDVIALDSCPIAHPALPDVLAHRWPADQVTAITSSSGDGLVLVDGVRGAVPKVAAGGVVADGSRLRGRTYVREQVHHREFRVSGAGFWQVHPDAATVLVDAVLQAAAVQPGQTVADLYAGVGLFAAFLAEGTGENGRVVSVEADARAARDARRNLHDLPQVHLVGGTVDRAFADGAVGARCDRIVLDPPRSGAGAAVVRAIAGARPGRVVYVACDPAALARDVATFATYGYALTGLRTFDLFPMTQHVECVALLEPGE